MAKKQVSSRERARADATHKWFELVMCGEGMAGEMLFASERSIALFKNRNERSDNSSNFD